MTQQSAELVRQQYEAARAQADARQITDEDIERARARIGVEVPHLRPDWHVCNLDALYHYCQGLGDDNPLYWNEEYARKTRWGGLIAPPLFQRGMGVSRVKEIDPEVRARGEHALSGVHNWYSGDNIEFFQPIRVGDQITIKSYLKEVVVKKSEFAGRTVHRISRSERANQLGHLVSYADTLNITGGRERTTGERTKYADLEPAFYTPEQIQEIAAQYRQEVKNRRGATPRYWEDTQEGDEVTPILKGPLTVSDIIAWNYGDGLTMIPGAHRIAYLAYLRHPNGFPINQAGIPDVAERVHWEEEMAHRTGNPAPYDYGAQRNAWMAQLVTDWMGDDAWMRHLAVQFRRFNYIGDIQWLKGKVVKKYTQEQEYRVDLDLWAEDQRGRQTTIGQATVMLPSKVAGPVKLPTITPDWW
ncbi:MAG: MaoC family dehydratase N-terminal domain-containing protein [Chloroflexi bacterium]|nr:MaoC family dehydratase N-terminal domain-containing protein [Chloroflexota bacterium]